MMNPIFLPFICLFLPFILQYFEAKYKWFGSVVWAYFLGIICGNLGWNQSVEPFVMPLISVAVPLSIPLLLFQADFKPWLFHAKYSVLSFLFACFSVIITAFSATYIFNKSPILPEISSMLVGTCIGGSANLNAIGLGIEAKPETIALANGLDVFWGGILLIFLTSVGIQMVRKFLTKPNISIEPFPDEVILIEKISYINIFYSLGLSILIFSIAISISFLLFSEILAIFIFFFVTLAGTLASLHIRVRKLKHTESIGNYLILVFCIGIASMIHLSTFFNQSLDYFWLGAWMNFGSVFIHLLMAKLFKIDSETFIITCVATIYSPAFVGMFAKRMNNKAVILNGFTAGIAGFSIATYIGILLFSLLN